MKIEGQTALVTGGTAGIGREIALRLAARRARVIITGRNRDAAEEVMSLGEGRISFIEAELSRPEGQARLIRDVRAGFPDLSILVNNAGIQVNMPATGIGDEGLMEAFRSEIGINLEAPVALSLGLMPLLALQQRGAIVNISSGLAIAPKRTAPVYSATKAGLSAFSRALRYRCEDAAPHVSVHDVIMAFVDTAMTAGRGTRKMHPADAARAVISGLERDRPRIFVGKARILAMLDRISPSLAGRILRNG